MVRGKIQLLVILCAMIWQSHLFLWWDLRVKMLYVSKGMLSLVSTEKS